MPNEDLAAIPRPSWLQQLLGHENLETTAIYTEVTIKQLIEVRARCTMPQDSLIYDDDNRLSTRSGSAVAFDDNGNMTSAPLPNGSNGTYVYGLGLLYEVTGSATKTYHCDQVGSTLAITDDSQVVTDRVGYSPFGVVKERTNPAGTATDTPFLFNGELGVMTDANGLLYMRARYYNPRLMRFCNADPIKFDGGLNWYAFVGNNPIGKTDPSGLQDFIAGFMVGPAVPPGSYTYNGPTTVGGMATAVGQSYVQAGQTVGAAAKDFVTSGRSSEKQALMAAITSPVWKGLPTVASGAGLATSIGSVAKIVSNPGTAKSVAEIATHAASLASNGYTVATAGGGLATDLTDGSTYGTAVDVVTAYYTPPDKGHVIAVIAWAVSKIVTPTQPTADTPATPTSGCRR